MQARFLTEIGRESFDKYLNDIKLGNNAEKPDLNTEPFSTELDVELDIGENVTFKNRLEMGIYLNNHFIEMNIQSQMITANAGFWDWLSYYWIEKIIKNEDNTYKKIREKDAYLINRASTREYQRHVIFPTWSVVSTYGEQHAKIFLYSDNLNQQADTLENILCRKDFAPSNSLVEIFYTLYWDEKKDKLKTGITTRTRPGNIRRFVDVVKQLLINYDITRMPPEKIMEILPSEFDHWKK